MPSNLNFNPLNAITTPFVIIRVSTLIFRI
jgi:hypothetical protein